MSTAFDEVAQAVVGRYAPEWTQRLSDMFLDVAGSPDEHTWRDRMTELALYVERIELRTVMGHDKETDE